MPRRGKGRYMAWKDMAFEFVQTHPEGVSAERLLDEVHTGFKNRQPATVRQATELLKRDSRFNAYYPDKGSKSLSGQHYKVLQWVVNE